MISSARRLSASFAAVVALTAALLIPAASASAWHWNNCTEAPADLPPGFDSTCPAVGLSPASVMSATLELTMLDDLSFDNGTIWQDPHRSHPEENDHLTTKGPSSGTGGVWRMESTTLESFVSEFSVSARIIDTGTPTAIWLRADLYWDARPDGLGIWKSECRLYDDDPFGKGRMLPIDLDWGTHENTPFDCVTHKDSATPYAKSHVAASITLASLSWGTVRATLATAGDVTLTAGSVQSPIARFLVDGTKTPADTAAAARDVATSTPLTFEAFRRNAEPSGNAQGTAVYQITERGFPTPYWVRAWAQNYKWLSFYYSDETCEVFRGDPRAGGTAAADAPYVCSESDVSGRKTTDWRLTWTVTAAPMQMVAPITSGWLASQCASAGTTCVFLPHTIGPGVDEGGPISARLWNTTGAAATRGVDYDAQRVGTTSLPLPDRTWTPALTAVIDNVSLMYGVKLSATVRDRGVSAVTVAPHSVAWLEAAGPSVTLTGDYLIHFEGAWYRVNDITASVPEVSGALTVRCAPIAEHAASGSACTGSAMSITGRTVADTTIAAYGGTRPTPRPTPPAPPLAILTPGLAELTAGTAAREERLAHTGGRGIGPILAIVGTVALLGGAGLVGGVARRRHRGHRRRAIIDELGDRPNLAAREVAASREHGAANPPTSYEGAGRRPGR